MHFYIYKINIYLDGYKKKGKQIVLFPARILNISYKKKLSLLAGDEYAKLMRA